MGDLRTMKKGFTLIELMVVVLLIGILASAAAPSMQKTMDKNRATDAISTMMQIANAQRTCRVNNITRQDDNCPAEQLSENHKLVLNNYIPNRNWGSETFYFGTALLRTDASVCKVNSVEIKYVSLDSCTAKKTGSGVPAYYVQSGLCKRHNNTGVAYDYCPSM